MNQFNMSNMEIEEFCEALVLDYIAELLRDCFANFKDNVFQFRLRIACERASELHTCLPF